MSESSIDTIHKEQAYSARVVREVLSSLGARLGLVWIVLMIICAVFAPLISNTHPYLMIVAGEFSSPFLKYLTWIDVALLCSFLGAIIIWFGLKSIEGWKRLLLMVLVSLLMSILSAWSVSSPRAVIYDQYRMGLESGKIQSAYFAPIPYSPTDRSRDNPVPLQPPGAKHLLGTDEDGADVLSRMIHGSRIALGIGLVATFTSLFLGILYGGVMGFYSGWIDILMMRFLEIFE